jgi:hypothetical protein
MFLPIVWAACALVIVTSAWRVGRRPEALRTARIAMAVLYLGAGAAVNAAFVLRGDDYAAFARSSYLPFVRDTWESLVVPNHALFIGALVVFEAAIGVLVLLGQRQTQVAYGAAIAFHVALLSYGWGFYEWALPMLFALARLLRAELAARPVIDATPALPAVTTRA